jgi:telomerase reverse transcriptase
VNSPPHQGRQADRQRLLRYIDDFLYITDDFSTAKRFSALMSHGFADYGAFISTGKTMTSFEYTRGQVTPVCPLQPDGTSCKC